MPAPVVPPAPGMQPAPSAPVTANEGAERRGPVAPPPDYAGRYATPDWRRERTTEDDPRKGQVVMPLNPAVQAQLTQQLAQITAQIASGVARASYEGKSTEFRSLEELYKIRDDLMAQLGMTGGRVRRTVAAYNSGFYPGGGPY